MTSLNHEAIETIKLPIKYTDLADGEEKHCIKQWPIIYPHSIMCFLLERAGLTIPSSKVHEYWKFNHEVGEAWAQHSEWDRIPVGLYGDSARVNTAFGSEHVLGLFVNLILWTPSSVRCSRFLVFAIGEHQLWKHFTMDCVLRHVTWSLNALVAGVHPSQGPFNEPLSRGLHALANQPMSFRCQITEVRGDWSWHKKLWRFYQTSWNGIKVCHWCLAKSKSLDRRELYWSFDEHSWSGGCFDLEEFVAERMPPLQLCALGAYLI